MEFGKYNMLEVTRFTAHGAYLCDKEGREVLLPNKYVPEGLQEDDYIRVFVYSDSEDRPVATTLVPNAFRDQFAILTVKETTGIGAWLDWGLEKDLLLPESEQYVRVHAGDKVVVRVLLDPRSERIIASSRIGSFLDDETEVLQKGDEMELWVSDISPIGYMCLANQRYRGILFKNEVFRPLSVGDVVNGFVKNVRDDGKLDFSLHRNTLHQIEDNTEKILQTIRDSDGFLAMGDFSSPEEIRQRFQMSKKVFKQIIGKLYKAKQIMLTEKGITLNKE